MSDFREYSAAFHARNDDVLHFGVLGMKWGVRRYQNKDGSLTEAGKKHYGYNDLLKNDKGATVLKKGSTVQRVSDTDETNKERKDGSTHTYISYTDLDNFKYKQFSTALGGHNFTLESPLGYVSNYELKEDVVIPSLQKQIDKATEHVKSMSMKEVKKLLIDRKGYTESTIYKDPEDFVRDLCRENDKNGDINALRQRAYAHYNRALIADKKLRDGYFKLLQEEGYNAVADFNDQTKVVTDSKGDPTTVKGFADKPVILFNKDKSMELKKVEKITPEMMMKEANGFAKKYGRKEALKSAAGAVLGALAVSPTAFVHPAIFAAFAMNTIPIGMMLGASSDGLKKDQYTRIYNTYKNLMNLRDKDPVKYKAKMTEIIELANKKTI